MPEAETAEVVRELRVVAEHLSHAGLVLLNTKQAVERGANLIERLARESADLRARLTAAVEALQPFGDGIPERVPDETLLSLIWMERGALGRRTRGSALLHGRTAAHLRHARAIVQSERERSARPAGEAVREDAR